MNNRLLKRIILEEIKNVLKEANIEQGSSGKEVLDIQKALKQLKYNLGPSDIDGKFGDYTKSAIKSFQKDNKINPTGIVDEETKKILFQKAGEKFLSPGFTMLDTGVKKIKSKCPKINKTESKVIEYEYMAQEFMDKKIPTRIACELAYIKIRPQFGNKSIFIIDTRQKLIYLYDQKGKFVAKSPIISGANAQSENKKLIAEALKYNDEKMKGMGYVYVNDRWYKNGKPLSDEEVYKAYLDGINKTKTRFIPRGIYSVGLSAKSSRDVGSESGDNVWRLKQGEKLIGPALHGMLIEPKRFAYIDKVRKKAGGDVNDPAVSQAYINYLDANLGTEAGGSMSYGCINVPLDFLTKMRSYITTSIIFVVGEQKQNYLVQNSNDFFNKSVESDDVQQYAESYTNKLPVSLPGQEQLGRVEVGYA